MWGWCYYVSFWLFFFFVFDEVDVVLDNLNVVKVVVYICVKLCLEVKDGDGGKGIGF